MAVSVFIFPAIKVYAATPTFENASTYQTDVRNLFQNTYDTMSAETNFIIKGNDLCKNFLETDAAGHYKVTKNSQGEDTFNTTQLVQILPEEQLMDMKASNDNAYVRMAMEQYAVASGVSYHYETDGTITVDSITFRYGFTWHDGSAALAAKNTVISHVKSYLNSSAYPSTSSEFIKLKAINNYICETFQYDYRLFVEAEKSQTIYTAYGMITDSGAIGGYKRGVCQAYAMYGYIMLKQAGFEAITVDGEAGGGGHAWNMTRTQSQWYHIDFTWDDPISDGNPSPYILRQSGAGIVEETYLLRTDAELSVNHSWSPIQNGYTYPVSATVKNPETTPMPSILPTQYNPVPTITMIPPTKAPVHTPTKAAPTKTAPTAAGSGTGSTASIAEATTNTDSTERSAQTATLSMDTSSASDSTPGHQPTTGSDSDRNPGMTNPVWAGGLIVLSLILAMMGLIAFRRKARYK